MAQGTTINSTGTTLSGGEGSGTHSGILSALNAIRYLKILRAIENNKPRNRVIEPEVPSDDDEPIDVEFEESQCPAVKQLASASQAALPESRKLLTAGDIDRDDDLLVKVGIGEQRIKDHYSNIEGRLQSLNLDQKRAVGIAMLGGLPDRNVSIEAMNETGEALRFEASSERNSGWSVGTKASTLDISAQEMDEQLQKQDASAIKNIRGVINETFEGDGPHTVSGPRFTIAMDHNTVFVVENDSGRILDSVELDTVSGDVLKASQEVNGQNRSDQAREALADYRALGGAVVSATPVPRSKQQELTP